MEIFEDKLKNYLILDKKCNNSSNTLKDRISSIINNEKEMIKRLKMEYSEIDNISKKQPNELFAKIDKNDRRSKSTTFY